MWRRLSSREKCLVAFLALFCSCFVLYKLIVKDQLLYLIEMKNTLKNINAKIGAAEQMAGSYQREVEFLNRAEKQLNGLKTMFSSEVGDGPALVWIGPEAVDAKVEILSYTPLPAVNKDVYVELPVKVAVRGSYPGVADFIARLEGRSGFTEIRSLRIGPPAGGGPGARQDGWADLRGGFAGSQNKISNDAAALPGTAAPDGGGAMGAGAPQERGAPPLPGAVGAGVVADIVFVVYSLPDSAVKLEAPPAAGEGRGRVDPFLPVENQN